MQLKWPMLWDLFSLFPAHAGVILEEQKKAIRAGSFPRTRGGDPENSFTKSFEEHFSPHTRG